MNKQEVINKVRLQLAWVIDANSEHALSLTEIFDHAEKAIRSAVLSDLLNDPEFPKEETFEFKSAAEGWDSHTIGIKHAMDGANAMRSAIIKFLKTKV